MTFHFKILIEGDSEDKENIKFLYKICRAKYGMRIRLFMNRK